MEQFTVFFSVFAALLVSFLRPSYALAVYISALFWYPGYVKIYIGTADITVGRIVTAALLLRCLLSPKIMRYFKWNKLDTALSVCIFVFTSVYLIAQPNLQAVTNRSGAIMDSLLAYFAGRLIVTHHKTITDAVKIIAVVLAPLAIFGLTESVWEWTPFERLCRDFEWWQHIKNYEGRWGLERAVGSFSHSILFGCAFCLVFPLIYHICVTNRRNIFWWILLVIAAIGCFSSLSSGPWMMLITIWICIALEKHKYIIKPFAVLFAMGCVLIGIISNRPFYHVFVSYLNPLGGAGWHRARLIDASIHFFNEWWLIGYGERDPNWGVFLGGMATTDITNEFILTGVKYGIWGVLTLCIVLYYALKGIYNSYQNTSNWKERNLYWCLGTIIVSTILVWLSVSYFGGQMVSLFYCILGIIGSVSTFKSARIITTRIQKKPSYSSKIRGDFLYNAR